MLTQEDIDNWDKGYKVKDISTLVADMENVIKGLGDWNEAVNSRMGMGVAKIIKDRFSKPQTPRTNLSMSALGTPCHRKLWYKVNKPELAIPLILLWGSKIGWMLMVLKVVEMQSLTV